ncbi:MAG: STAS domain-containing protein [Bacteroidales bacterium]|nr:STAS domain-containing protein [Bacteroidales bacterium]
MFNISTSSTESLVTLVPEGRLDTINSISLESVLCPILDNQDYIIINFSKCTYLASSGIRLLIMATKSLSSKGGGLFLSNLSPEVYMVLEMAGLISVLQIAKSEEIARKRISLIREEKIKSHELQFGGATYLVECLADSALRSFMWYDPDIVGYDELVIASGVGSPAESTDDSSDDRGIFVLIGNCCGFIPFNTTIPPDFRVMSEPSKGALYIDRAFSLKGEATYRVRLISPENVAMTNIKEALMHIAEKSASDSLRAVAIADFNMATPSLTIIFKTENAANGIFPTTIYGARFSLLNILKPENEGSFISFASRNLTIDNIISVTTTDVAPVLNNPLMWIFCSEGWIAPDSERIKVECSDGLEMQPYKRYLSRKLYNDSARIVVKMLHGGYSAETFQVDSYDREGRKMRPTVLKIAGRDIISREAERCTNYALPYIMNNSAMVLGTVNFCDKGALRYNFVGIGGEGSKLEWLTHYFNTMPVEQLETLFDKIFLKILNPWYGQPVIKEIKQYKDHDPRLTFFPNLCDVAERELDISVDDKYIVIDGIDREQINPYWFLKYEYKRREERTIDYNVSVCHGDLNMQNILLDRDMNVYLIDFSETRPRAVISDFARLEVIFMIESALLDTPRNIKKTIDLVYDFYNQEVIDKKRSFIWKGEIPEIVRRNISLAYKMREYAIQSLPEDRSIVQYYIAMLEWTLPIVCYGSVSLNHKKLSAFIAGKLCEKLLELD